MNRLLEPVMQEPIVAACRETVRLDLSKVNAPGVHHLLDDGDWLGARQPNTDSFIRALRDFLAVV